MNNNVPQSNYGMVGLDFHSRHNPIIHFILYLTNEGSGRKNAQKRNVGNIIMNNYLYIISLLC